jgi:hypothetical protein
MQQPFTIFISITRISVKDEVLHSKIVLNEKEF